MAQEELKVLIHMKGDSALVGVHQKDTDPVMERVAPPASLDEVLAAVPGIVARAREKWAASPKNPAYQGPPVAPAPAPRPQMAQVAPTRPTETARARLF